MMKNILFIFCAILVLVFISDYITEENIIPEDAIRIRVIASSNNDEAQELKVEIKEELEDYLYKQIQGVRSIEDADKVIKESIPQVKTIIDKYTSDYDVNYGMNYFPEKEYKGIIYEAGEYQSLVVTLGNGTGNNWWCVLFPPLCLLEAEESTDVEYRSYVSEMIDKYIK